jgi:hypothetical protein
MMPVFDQSGNLPPGVHWASWDEIVMRFGTNQHRLNLLLGMKSALDVLHQAGCRTVYIDGSFVSNKTYPGDFDCCWDTTGVKGELLELTLMDMRDGRAAQKEMYGGELIPCFPPQEDGKPSSLEWF